MKYALPIFPSIEIRLILFSIESFMKSFNKSGQRLFGVIDIFVQIKKKK